MTAHWDAPASEWRSDLPADCTLRELGRKLRAQGLTWPQIGDRLGMDENRARMPIKYPWRAGNKPAPKPRVRRAKPWQERVAAAYGLTWQQLQAIRAAGLTVKQFKEMAEDRSAKGRVA